MFRERIARSYPSLSPNFRKIADFILASHHRAAFMSASRLARHLGMDVATVTRFAQYLGYEGYVQLIREIQEAVAEEMRQARAAVVEQQESARGLLAQILWRDWANLERTIRNLPLDQAEQAIAALRSARRIYLVGEGVGGGLAQVAGTYLRMIRADAVVLHEGLFDLALVLKDLGPQDLVIGIGFTSYAFAATRALELARKVGARTIGVISQADCPVAQAAEILLTCSAVENGYQPSPTGIAAILFALCYSFPLSDPEEYNRQLLRFQNCYAALTEGSPQGEVNVLPDLIQRF